MEALKEKIRHVPDFPKAGILFYDVTTLLRDPEGLKRGASLPLVRGEGSARAHLRRRAADREREAPRGGLW